MNESAGQNRLWKKLEIYAGFVILRELCYGSINVASARFFCRERRFFFLSKLGLCMCHLELFSLHVGCNFAVFMFPLVCWSCRTASVRHIKLCSRICVRATKLRKYVRQAGAVETEGDKCDKPVHGPVAFLFVNVCLIRSVIQATLFPGNICCMQCIGGILKAKFFFFLSVDCFTTRITGNRPVGFTLQLNLLQ